MADFRIVRLDVVRAGGHLCVRFIGIDGDGNDVGLLLPAAGLGATLAIANKKVDEFNAELNPPPGWRRVTPLPGTPCQVRQFSTTDSETVLLCLTEGGPLSGLDLSFSPSEARALAADLLKTADDIDRQPPGGSGPAH